MCSSSRKKASKNAVVGKPECLYNPSFTGVFGKPDIKKPPALGGGLFVSAWCYYSPSLDLLGLFIVAYIPYAIGICIGLVRICGVRAVVIGIKNSITV